MRHLVLLSLSFLLFSSCAKEEQISIKEYLELHNIDAKFHTSGIFYTIDKEGTGDHPISTSSVTVHYKGYYLDGEEFDSSLAGDPLTFKLTGVIKGWTLGIPLYKKGGSGTLYIPAHLAYGSNPPRGIREDAPLAFDVQLIDWK